VPFLSIAITVLPQNENTGYFIFATISSFILPFAKLRLI
jgi:hypothetical protein